MLSSDGVRRLGFLVSVSWMLMMEKRKLSCALISRVSVLCFCGFAARLSRTSPLSSRLCDCPGVLVAEATRRRTRVAFMGGIKCAAGSCVRLLDLLAAGSEERPGAYFSFSDQFSRFRYTLPISKASFYSQRCRFLFLFSLVFCLFSRFMAMRYRTQQLRP